MIRLPQQSIIIKNIMHFKAFYINQLFLGQHLRYFISSLPSTVPHPGFFDVVSTSHSQMSGPRWYLYSRCFQVSSKFDVFVLLSHTRLSFVTTSHNGSSTVTCFQILLQDCTKLLSTCFLKIILNISHQQHFQHFQFRMSD